MCRNMVPLAKYGSLLYTKYCADFSLHLTDVSPCFMYSITMQGLMVSAEMVNSDMSVVRILHNQANE